MFKKNIQVSCSSSHCSNFFLCTSVLRPIRTQNSFSAIIVRTVFSDNPVNSQVSFTERRSFSFPSRSFFSILIYFFLSILQIHLQCTVIFLLMPKTFQVLPALLSLPVWISSQLNPVQCHMPYNMH